MAYSNGIKEMKPQSAKAKGRKLQQYVRDKMLKLAQLHVDEIRSTSMGAGGEDVLLSPTARACYPVSIECKSKKAFAVYKDYAQAEANAGNWEPVLIIKQDRSKPLAVVDLDYLLHLILADTEGLPYEA